VTSNNDDEQDLRLAGRPAILLALLMAIGAGFILCGYELIRTTSNTLFVTVYGKDALPFGMALIPIGVTLALYYYGRLLSLIGPRRTLLVTTLLSIVTMALCYVGIRLGMRAARGVLFVFKESYVVLLIEQYWSYLDSLLNRQWARRLNGPITGVASIGAVSAGELLYRLSGSWGTLNMLLLAAAVTLPAAWFGNIAYRHFGEPIDKPKPDSGTHKAEGPIAALGLDLFKKQRVLLLIVGLVISAQVVATAQELLFKSLLQDQFPDPDVQNAVSGRFYMWLNLGAMFFQLVATPLLLSFVPFSVIHVMIPCIHLATLTYSLLQPSSLYRAELSYFLFKALDYSLFRSAKELLYLPLSFDVRYRAKEIIDVLGYRVSKGITSLSITFLQHAGVIFSSPVYAGIGLFGAAIWLGLAPPIARYGQGK
jgi:AAA family ATP:ADP antiporter